MGEIKHTPTPWYILGEDELAGVEFVEISSGELGTSSHRTIGWIGCHHDGLRDEDDINAALIVRAVNRDALFDEMVEALEPLNRLAEEVIGGGLYATKPDSAELWGFNNAVITYGHLRRARAVLAKAREAGE